MWNFGSEISDVWSMETMTEHATVTITLWLWCFSSYCIAAWSEGKYLIDYSLLIPYRSHRRREDLERMGSRRDDFWRRARIWQRWVVEYSGWEVGAAGGVSIPAQALSVACRAEDMSGRQTSSKKAREHLEGVPWLECGRTVEEEEEGHNPNKPFLL